MSMQREKRMLNRPSSSFMFYTNKVTQKHLMPHCTAAPKDFSLQLWTCSSSPTCTTYRIQARHILAASATTTGSVVGLGLSLCCWTVWNVNMGVNYTYYGHHRGIRITTYTDARWQPLVQKNEANAEVPWTCIPPGENSVCKKKSVCMKANEKMNLLLTWFMSSVNWFQRLLCSQSLVSSLLQHSMMFIL